MCKLDKAMQAAKNSLASKTPDGIQDYVEITLKLMQKALEGIPCSAVEQFLSSVPNALLREYIIRNIHAGGRGKRLVDLPWTNTSDPVYVRHIAYENAIASVEAFTHFGQSMEGLRMTYRSSPNAPTNVDGIKRDLAGFWLAVIDLLEAPEDPTLMPVVALPDNIQRLASAKRRFEGWI